MSGRALQKRAEPVDERGDLKERTEVEPADDSPTNVVRDPHSPPTRLPSLQFPTDRLPQLGVGIVKRLPNLGSAPTPDHHDPKVNHNIDPSLPLPVIPEKSMFNLWENTQTQTEVRWRPPENRSHFSGMSYQLQFRIGESDWTELAENRQTLYRVYYVDGVAIFGRQKINQEQGVRMARLRIRPVGEINDRGKVEKKIGPWSEEILFSLEGSSAKVREIKE